MGYDAHRKSHTNDAVPILRLAHRGRCVDAIQLAVRVLVGRDSIEDFARGARRQPRAPLRPGRLRRHLIVSHAARAATRACACPAKYGKTRGVSM